MSTAPKTAPKRGDTASARKSTAARKHPRASVKQPVPNAMTTPESTDAEIGQSAEIEAPVVDATTAAALPVRENEEPWTAAELNEVEEELLADAGRLRSEIALADRGIADLLRDASEGAGEDQADTGSKNFEREHEMSIANNTREMLVQTERALARIASGTYGVCESCGQAIGKARLQAFPRATLCVVCKQREERR